MHPENLSIVVAVNNRQILHNNLLQSPDLAAEGMPHQVIVKEGFASAGAAYNSGLDQATNDLVAFIHQDVYLPVDWVREVVASIRLLDAQAAPWGVLGCFGVSERDPRGVGQVYSTGWGLQGKPPLQPVPVETLDEIVLIIRKSSGLRFDPNLPHFHMYGVDICLEARHRGLLCYALPAFCVHNTNQLLALPVEFETGYRYVKRKWSRYLPIRTSCTVIDRFDRDLNRRKLEALVNRALFRTKTPIPRMDDPRAGLQGQSGTISASSQP
jgi:Glycosyltransferase like family